jgi:hypothetical protein
MMKSLLSIFLIFQSGLVRASECQAPSQGHLEMRLKESFHGKLAERELKEWMIHPKNYEIGQKIKELDRRTKFSPQRLDREALQYEAQMKFEQAIENTGRPNVMDHFPATGTQSKVSASPGALTIEMDKLDKEDLDVIPKEILDMLEPKVKIHYYYPYDKFEYLVTYAGKEQPIESALLKVQKAMEDHCERRMVDNVEYRAWYQKSQGVAPSTGSSRGGRSGSGSGAGQ